MKNIFLSSVFLQVFVFISQAQNPPSILWQKSLGGSQDDYANDIEETFDNGFIVAGSSLSNDGDVTGHHGDTNHEDCWIVKLDNGGNIQWQKSLGSYLFDGANTIQQTSDGGFILVGSSNSNGGDVTGHHGSIDYWDYWVAKLDTSGNIQWEESLGGTLDDEGYFIQQTSDQGYIIAGSSASNDFDVTGNHGEEDYWVVKLDNSGIIQWQKCFGGTGYDLATCIQQTIDGGYIVAGFSSSNDSDVTGNHGGDDYWIVRLDSVGTIVWQKSFGGSDEDEAFSVQQCLDDGFIIAGYSYSNDGDVTGHHGDPGVYNDYWVVKLDSNGSIQWEKSLGGVGPDIAYSIKQTVQGEYIIAGYSRSDDGDVSGNHGWVDYWVIKLDSNGSIQWQKSLGGTQYDGANSIKPTSNGGYIVAGMAQSNDGDVTEHHGSTTLSDYWIVKLGCITVYADIDSDGYGNFNSPENSCLAIGNYVVDSSDCDDSNFSIHPNAIEVCNGLDDNCNGQIDEGVMLTFYFDADSDNYGNAAIHTIACLPPTGYASDSTDCNDGDPNIHPGAVEICNNADDNCNGVIDEGVQLTYFLDADSDGYGNPAIDSLACTIPQGYVVDSTDCNDSNPNIHPGAIEIPNNGIDDDCDGLIDEIPTDVQNTPVLQSWSVFPNPTSGNSFINYTLSTPATVSIDLYDVLGNKLQQLVNGNQQSGEHNTTIDARKLTNGVYVLQIRAGEQVADEKIVVMK